jgi:tRNA-dihydrouridine synthase 4
MMLAPEYSRAQTARISDFASSHSERGVFWMKPRHTGSSADRGEDLDVFNGADLRTNTIASSSRAATQDRSPPVHSSRRLPSSLNPPSRDHRLVRGNLIAQFASNNGKSLADACEIIGVRPEGCADKTEEETGGFVGKKQVVADGPTDSRRLVDGVDLNCVSTASIYLSSHPY